ncbi:hypothetical protein GGR57DRAFT_468585 [Xylariaceae sp. FL1272]|nr:hypothetical protein GGR57DRAFT_468585 [Xylariaceae sp. FL1272]
MKKSATNSGVRTTTDVELNRGHTCTTDTSDFRGGVWGALQTNTAKGVAMTVGPAIQIRWRDSDLSTLETDPLTPGLAPSQAESTTSIPVVRATTISVVATRSSSSSESLTSLVPPISSTSSSKFVVINTIGRPTSTSIQTSTTLSMTEVRLSTNELPSTSSAPSPSITTPPQNGGSNSTDSSTSASDSKSRSPQTSNFTVAAITLTTILITILLLYAAHSTLRQYRRYRSGSKENAPVFIFLFTIPSRVSRVSRKLSDLSRSIPTRLYNLGVALLVAIRRQRPRHGPKCPEKAISELEATSPPSELGTGDPVGSKDNPAELATSDSRSFMSRVSRMFTVRSRRSSTSTSSTIFPRASMAVTVGVAVPVAVSRPLPPLPTEIPAVPGIPPSFTNTPAVRIVSTTSRSGRSVSAADAIR